MRGPLSGLLHGLSWLRLQRVLLAGGIRIDDLDDLKHLNVSEAIRLLAIANRLPDRTKQWVEEKYAEGLGHQVERRLYQLKQAAARSYEVGGLPDADLDGPWIVEYSYESIDDLRTGICKRASLAEQHTLSESQRRELQLWVVGAVGVLGWAIDVAVNFEQVRAAASQAALNISHWAQNADLRVWTILALVGVVMVTWISVHTLGEVDDLDDDLDLSSDGPLGPGSQPEGPGGRLSRPPPGPGGIVPTPLPPQPPPVGPGSSGGSSRPASPSGPTSPTGP
jgi:hypothetical protein